MNVTAGWEGWYKKWQRTWDSPAPDTLVITDEWAVEKGEGVVFHWTTPLPMRRQGDKVIIEGRRGIVEITIPAGTEAVIEELPLLNAARRALDEAPPRDRPLRPPLRRNPAPPHDPPAWRERDVACGSEAQVEVNRITFSSELTTKYSKHTNSRNRFRALRVVRGG